MNKTTKRKVNIWFIGISDRIILYLTVWKSIKRQIQNVNISLQWTWFHNLKALKYFWRIEILLKSTNLITGCAFVWPYLKLTCSLVHIMSLCYQTTFLNILYFRKLTDRVQAAIYTTQTFVMLQGQDTFS